MRKYELMMILNPSLTEDERTTLISMIEGELTENGAVICTKDHPGEKKLAYRISGSQTGYYLLYTLEKSGDFIAVNNAFNIKNDIWRYMFIKTEA